MYLCHDLLSSLKLVGLHLEQCVALYDLYVRLAWGPKDAHGKICQYIDSCPAASNLLQAQAPPTGETCQQPAYANSSIDKDEKCDQHSKGALRDFVQLPVTLQQMYVGVHFDCI